MIGDDIVSDVGGAMAFGMRAIQVRTGKWRYITLFVDIFSFYLIIFCY